MNEWRKNSKCQSILHDIIKGIRTVKSFGKEEMEINKLQPPQELAQVSSDNETLWAYLFPPITFLPESVNFWCSTSAVKNSERRNELGVLVQFTMYITYIYAPLRWFVSFPAGWRMP